MYNSWTASVILLTHIYLLFLQEDKTDAEKFTVAAETTTPSVGGNAQTTSHSIDAIMAGGGSSSSSSLLRPPPEINLPPPMSHLQQLPQDSLSQLPQTYYQQSGFHR